MKVCIYGCGAIGSHIAVRLLQAEAADVSLIARGAHLKAIREKGLTLRLAGEEATVAPPLATDDPTTVPPQDLVIVTLKAHSLPGCANDIASMTAPAGSVLFVTNGIPWWWTYGLPGEGPLDLVDPGHALWNRVTPQRAMGCIVYSGGHEIIEPGLVFGHAEPRWIVGEPDGSKSARMEALEALFRRCRLDIHLVEDVRREVWKKLLLNASGNTVSALTRLDSGSLAGSSELTALKIGIMREVVAVAAAMGTDLSDSFHPEKIEAASPPLPGRRPSMLQDVLAGRPIEVEAILGQPHSFAREAGVPTPVIDVVLPLLRGLNSTTTRGS